MRKFALLFLILATLAEANSRDLVRYIPQTSFSVVGADVVALRDNEIFLNMERKGQIWSYEDNSEITGYFQILKIDPRKDIQDFVFAKYVNPYGSAGKIHVLDVGRDMTSILQDRTATRYLDASLFRLSADEDQYAVLLEKRVLALGNLNSVKMAVDLARGKLANLIQNPELNLMLRKLPAEAAVWGMALPLSRRKAAAANAQQNTNAILTAFQSYYFYAIPAKTKANSHFYGQAADEKQATLVSAFMIGTLTVAKFRASEALAEVLDSVDIQHSGKDVHVSAVVTKEMVDAFFSGDLGIK